MAVEPTSNISDRTSSQLVFGAAVGAYIGTDAVRDAEPLKLFYLVIFLVLLVSFARMQLRIVDDVRNARMGSAWKLIGGALADAALTTLFAALAGFSWKILVPIFIAWFLTTVLDCLRPGREG